MDVRRALWAVAAVLAVVVAVSAVGSRRHQASTAPRDLGAALSDACWTIQNRISAYGFEHWEPLNRAYPPLDRVATLRAQILEIQQAALAPVFARHEGTARAAEAIRRYEATAAATRDVIRTADRADVPAYVDADVRMRRAILAARAAFERAGADNVCNFAI